MHPSVALLMSLVLTGGDDGAAPLRKQTSALNIPAPLTAVSDSTAINGAATAPITTWSQDAPLPTSTYYVEGEQVHEHGPIHTGTVYGGHCESCGNSGCPHMARLLHVFRSPGDMPQHIPYIAEPKNYYYFRPYNWFHIVEHQRDVRNYLPPGDVRHPYDTRFLQDIYLQIEEKHGDLEILPGFVPGSGSPNDTLPPPMNNTGLLPLQTYGNQSQGDFDAPAIFPASSRRVRQ